MATPGRYIEANGPRVYCKAYGEDEVLSRPGVSKEPGRFNSTFYGLRGREIGHIHRRSVAPSRSQSRAVKCRTGKGKSIPRHVVPGSPTALTHPLRDEKDLSGVLALLRLAYVLATDNADNASP